MTAVALAVPALLSLAPLLFAAGPPPRETEDRARAEAQVRRAREAYERAYEALRAAYAQSESWYLSLREDRAAEARVRIEACARAALEALAVEAREGRRDLTTRTRANSFVRQRLTENLPSAGVPPALSSLLASQLADLLCAEGEVPAAEAASAALGSIFDLERPFHESWNRGLFREVAAAREYARAQTDLAEAVGRLERIVRPDRFHPAYASIPEGMVLVPGGTYPAGNDTGWDLDTERTRKSFEISLPSFYIDRTEVTNRRYQRFLESLPPGEAQKRIPPTWLKTPGSSAPPPGREDHPVTGVSLEDAFAFAAWAGMRLPTEDEWSVAARGPELSVYPWGNVWDPKRSNHAGASRGDTVPAGSLPGDRSPSGCLDMGGNVSEWTASYPDGRRVTRVKENSNVVLRGGSFRRSGSKESASWRWAYPAITTREPDIGFRCAQDAPER